MKKVFFIGRFQPFHLGHLSVVQDIDQRDDVDEILIGIGSSQHQGTKKNPYSFEQRKEIIEKSLKDILKKKKIFAIPDVNDNQAWVDHVVKIVGKIDEIYTGNDLVEQLFKEKKYQVNHIQPTIDISGTKIRENMPNWKKYVHNDVINILSKFNEKIN